MRLPLHLASLCLALSAAACRQQEDDYQPEVDAPDFFGGGVPDGAAGTLAAETKLLASSEKYGDVVWYGVADAFAVSQPDAANGAGRVVLLDVDGAEVGSVVGPEGAGLGATLAIVGDLLVAGTADGSLFAWQAERGAVDLDVLDVADGMLVGADAPPVAVSVGSDAWVIDPGAGALYSFDGLAGRDADLSDLEPVSFPCGEISGCGLSVAADPTGNGALLGLSGGYAQHVAADGQPDWFIADRFVLDGAMPQPGDGVTSVMAEGDGFVVAGYRHGAELPPSARWVAADGSSSEEDDTYVTTTAYGALDGVPYRVAGMNAWLWRLGVEPETGSGTLVSAETTACWMPRVATDGLGHVAMVCSGEGTALFGELSWR